MDILTPLAKVVAQSQDDSMSIPSTCAGNENIRNSSQGNGIGDGVSLNARRLKLRNAGFRAALLPTRRLSPNQQTGIGAGFIRNDNIENATAGHVKARYSSSPDSTTPLNILQEIRNCSQRRTTPQSPLGDFFGFADDENEGVISQNHTNSMSSKTGSIKASKSRKSSRRVSSFQPTKYIEYLENQLVVATKKLETLQTPDTISGQAAKIRKLEKRTQELSSQLDDWEKNFEERVNDQVFERLYGESDLRLKILTLEQTAASKETHIEELGKELEDAKAKLEEAESLETSLNRRIDVLTELLAKSPMRTSVSLSNTDFPTPTGPTKPLLHRLSTSPIRYSQGIDEFNDAQQIDSLVSPTNLSRRFSLRTNESAVETDNESQDFNIFSRPSSGIFSSRSSQTSSSRPVSMFSTTSVSTWTSADEKPASRARKARRFAPGSAGLKPLLLATTAGLQSPTRSFETPKKQQIESHSLNDTSWESADELAASTPSRPGYRRPYSWTYSPNITKYTSILENEGSDEDTFIVSTNDDDLPAYLKHLAVEHQVRALNEPQVGSSPIPTNLSLYQELNAGQSFNDSSDDLNQAYDSPCPASANQSTDKSPFVSTKETKYPIGVPEDSFVSELSKTIIKSNLSGSLASQQDSRLISSFALPTSRPQMPYLAGLVTILGQKPLDLVRAILLRSWTRGSTQLGRLMLRIANMFLTPKKSKNAGLSQTLMTDRTEPLVPYPGALSDEVSPAKSIAISQAIKSDNGRENGTKRSLEIASLLSRLQAFAFPAANHQRPHRCSCCIDPPAKRSLKLWTKLVIALVVAVGCAMLEGPAAVLETEDLDRCIARRDDKKA